MISWFNFFSWKNVKNVIFDQSGALRLERLKSLLEVLTEESNKNLLPVAESSIKLLFSQQGELLRSHLLMTLIKDDKLDSSDI